MTKQQLIEDNMGLVYHIVRRDYPTYVNDEDIIQCGMLGLCKAADKWDESKSQFSTFAGKCIKNEISQEFRRRAKHQGVLSLDYTVDGDDGEKFTFGDFIPGEEDVTYVEFTVDSRRLTDRERQVCELLQAGHNQVNIGKKLGITKQAVWKIIRKLKALRGAEE